MANTVLIQEIAYDALINAQLVYRDFGGPRPRSAIVAYCNGEISSSSLARNCTQIELVEFSRLEYSVCVRWMDTHHGVFRCQPVHGRCRYPDEFIHHTNCRYHVPLPPDIEHPPPRTGHGHQAHGSRPGHGHQAHGSRHGHSHHAHGGGHTRVSPNFSGGRHISGGRIGRVGGHHNHFIEDNLHDASLCGNSDSRSGTGRSGRASLGGNGNGVATSRHGAAVRSGRSLRDPAARSETSRDLLLNTGTTHGGASRADRTPRSGAASHGGRDPRDRMAQGEAAQDSSANPGAPNRGAAPADTTSRTTNATHDLREPRFSTAQGVVPASAMSLIAAAAHHVEEPRNSTTQDATKANTAARPVVAASANTTFHTATAAHGIQQRLHSMALGAATAGTNSRTAAGARGFQAPAHSSAQGAAVKAYGGEISQGGQHGPQASRIGVSKSVRFQTGTQRAEAGVSEDY